MASKAIFVFLLLPMVIILATKNGLRIQPQAQTNKYLCSPGEASCMAVKDKTCKQLNLPCYDDLNQCQAACIVSPSPTPRPFANAGFYYCTINNACVKLRAGVMCTPLGGNCYQDETTCKSECEK